MHEYGKCVIHYIIRGYFRNLKQLIGKLIYDTTPTQNRMNHGVPPGTTAPIAPSLNATLRTVGWRSYNKNINNFFTYPHGTRPGGLPSGDDDSSCCS